MKIEIKVLDEELYKVEKLGGSYFDLPSYQTHGSCAMDLKSAEDITVLPGKRHKIKTGLAMWIGSSKVLAAGMVLPRSGLGVKGLVITNMVGIIDADYQGEIFIHAWNNNNEYINIDHQSNEGDWQEIERNTKDIIKIKRGDRIAQLMFVSILLPDWKHVLEFSNKTPRETGGFGSTGD